MIIIFDNSDQCSIARSEPKDNQSKDIKCPHEMGEAKFWALISLLIIAASCKCLLYLIFHLLLCHKPILFRSFKVVTFRQTLFQTFDDDIPGDKNNLMLLLASSRIKSPL